MFICQNCHKNQNHYVKPVMVVTEVRYPVVFDNPRAWEIKKEIKACSPCAVTLTGVDPKHFIDNPTLLALDVKQVMLTAIAKEEEHTQKSANLKKTYHQTENVVYSV